ncbi:MAG: hypothetical protein GXP14_13785 [Gammaproteobacteria bacterium]|nr:hypothetical protein [Gammaproteobacteria bacterium]
MFTQKNAEKLYKWLKKKGLAQVVIDIAPHADDQDFIQCPITCRVTVVSAKDGNVSELKNSAKWKKLNYGKQQIFTVGAESILGVIDKWWNKKTPESYEIHVFAEPLGDFANHYEPYSTTLILQAGETGEESLFFKPKKSGSRFNTNEIIQKPMRIIERRKIDDNDEA